MSGRTVSGRTVATLVAAVALAGCAGIPTTGAVHVGRPLSAPGVLSDPNPHVLPPLPQPGMTPLGVVQGFLRAMVDNDDDYGIARAYLTTRTAIAWDTTAGITTYDETTSRLLQVHGNGATRTVALLAPRTGFIDPRGDFTVAADRLDASFTLVKQAGEWRIDRLPPGVLLASVDAQRFYRLTDIYYLDRSGTTLVPEQVLIRPPPARAIPTALVRALLAGPGSWIAPAVRTAFPRGTDLVGNVPVDASGVAEVNLSGAVRQASSADLRQMSAQLVWTLRQDADIKSVRLLLDGSPLALPGAPENQPRDAWPAFDPAAPIRVPVATYDADGVLRTVGGRPPPGLSVADGLTDVVLSADARFVAGLHPVGHRQGLFVGRTGALPQQRLTGTTLTAPTFDPSGDVFTVVTDAAGRRVVELTPGGDRRDVSTSLTLLRHPVQAMRLSRDGSRVAAVVGPAGHGRLFVGRVSGSTGGLHFDGFRQVLPTASDVRGVTWRGPDEIVVTAAEPTGIRQVLGVDPDGYLGYSPRVFATEGVVGEPVDVAAAPQQSLLVVAAGVVWVDTRGGWRRVGVGAAPTYPD